MAQDAGCGSGCAASSAAGLVCGVAPRAASIWTDEAKARTGAALAPVMAKYGVSLGAIPPELTLLVVAGPLLWQSARAVSAQVDEAQEKAKRRQVERGEMQANPAPEGGTVAAAAQHEQMKLYGYGPAA